MVTSAGYGGGLHDASSVSSLNSFASMLFCSGVICSVRRTVAYHKMALHPPTLRFLFTALPFSINSWTTNPSAECWGAMLETRKLAMSISSDRCSEKKTERERERENIILNLIDTVSRLINYFCTLRTKSFVRLINE